MMLSTFPMENEVGLETREGRHFRVVKRGAEMSLGVEKVRARSFALPKHLRRRISSTSCPFNRICIPGQIE